MYPLKNKHTFKLSAYCANFYEVTSDQQLLDAYKKIDDLSIVLGEGSNSIFVDNYDGSIISNKIKGIRISQDATHYKLAVGAGENWHELVSYTLARNIYGLENLALIPGSVGASPIQNIGAYGVEVNTFIASVDYLNLDTLEFERIIAADCDFAYRDSIFKQSLYGKVIITKVNFLIPKDYHPVIKYGELSLLKKPTAQSIYKKVCEIRTRKLPDPHELGNAGSFFKNPVIPLLAFETIKEKYSDCPSYPSSIDEVKIPAAWLIDKLGFKGKCIGGICCHRYQPLVLTNDGNGYANDLLFLARDIKRSVKTTFGIELEHEVRLIGRKGLISL